MPSCFVQGMNALSAKVDNLVDIVKELVVLIKEKSNAESSFSSVSTGGGGKKKKPAKPKFFMNYKREWSDITASIDLHFASIPDALFTLDMADLLFHGTFKTLLSVSLYEATGIQHEDGRRTIGVKGVSRDTFTRALGYVALKVLCWFEVRCHHDRCESLWS